MRRSLLGRLVRDNRVEDVFRCGVVPVVISIATMTKYGGEWGVKERRAMMSGGRLRKTGGRNGEEAAGPLVLYRPALASSLRSVCHLNAEFALLYLPHISFELVLACASG
jgi:hypothetical protein